MGNSYEPTRGRDRRFRFEPAEQEPTSAPERDPARRGGRRARRLAMDRSRADAARLMPGRYERNRDRRVGIHSSGTLRPTRVLPSLGALRTPAHHHERHRLKSMQWS